MLEGILKFHIAPIDHVSMQSNITTILDKKNVLNRLVGMNFYKMGTLIV